MYALLAAVIDKAIMLRNVPFIIRTQNSACPASCLLRRTRMAMHDYNGSLWVVTWCVQRKKIIVAPGGGAQGPPMPGSATAGHHEQMTECDLGPSMQDCSQSSERYTGTDPCVALYIIRHSYNRIRHHQSQVKCTRCTIVTDWRQADAKMQSGRQQTELRWQ